MSSFLQDILFPYSSLSQGRLPEGGPWLESPPVARRPGIRITVLHRLTMASPEAPRALGCRGRLLLLLSLGWAQAAEAGQEAVPWDPAVADARDLASPAPSPSPGLLRGVTCEWLSGLSVADVRELAMAVKQNNLKLRADQLQCLAHRLSEHLASEDLDAFPRDMLPFLEYGRQWPRQGRGPRLAGMLSMPTGALSHSPAAFPGPQACGRLFSRGTKAGVGLLPRGAPQRRRLLRAALACRGVRGPQVSRADVRALGALACELPGRFVARSAEALLPRLASCPGALDEDQQAAARVALRRGGPPYGPPSNWSVSTLDALQGLVAVLDQPIIQDMPEDVRAAWLHRSSRLPTRRWPEAAAVHPRTRRDTKQACPPGREAREIHEELIFYAEWELAACVPGTLLARQMDRVNALPFTYQQIRVLKRTLDETYPQGYPEPLIRSLGDFFHYVSPEDIHRWNISSLQTLKALLEVSKGQQMDAQVTALIARYLLGRGQLDKDTMATLADLRPTYLCALRPEQLGSVPPRVLWAVRPRDLDSCSHKQLGILYSKARAAFQNVSGPAYSAKIQAFLGGARVEDLQALIRRNMSVDMAAFKRLPVATVVRLTVAEVQALLGPHAAGLKDAEQSSPVRDWVLRQRQEDLDRLGLGLRGGVPNGYLVLDAGFREAVSGAGPLLGPRPALTWTLTVLLAWTAS